MTTDEHVKALDELMDPGATLMVGTEVNGSGFEFRPLTAARIQANIIEILLDTREDWTESLSDGDLTYVTMSDTKANTWLSLRGVASTTTDPALIDELWSPFAGAYFDEGRDTPGIAVMRIEGQDGRYWSTASGRLGSLISMIKAKFGDPEQSGEHGDVKL